MNKKLLLTVCLAIQGVLGMKAQTNQQGIGTVALHHNGKATLFFAGNIQDALNAAETGDTIYLSEGWFPKFIAKPNITLLGAGENTIIGEDITIEGNDATLDTDTYMFRGLNLAHNFTITGSVKGLRIYQCQAREIIVNEGDFIVNDISIISSHIRNIQFRPSVSDFIVQNSKIGSLNGEVSSYGTVNFHYCNISDVYNDGCVFYNCIAKHIAGGTFFNSVYRNPYANAVGGAYNGEFEFDDDLNTPFSDEQFREWGIEAGVTFGDEPFNLELNVPHVVEHTMDVDNQNKTLKVTLKMNE